jgi:succinate-acetate transporter protein
MSDESVARIVRRNGDRMAPDATVARVVLRPIGSPLPLGAMALVPSGLLLAGLQLGWFPDSETASIPYLILGFAVPLQFAASILAFLGRDAVVGTGFGIFTGTWLAFGLSGLANGVTQTSKVLGVFFLAVGFLFALLMLGGVVAGKVAAGMIVLAGSARFLVSGLYELTAASGLKTAAGIVGLVFVGVAAYAGVASLMEDSARHTILPLGRRGLARTSFEDGLDAQLNDLEHEAGVREQL